MALSNYTNLTTHELENEFSTNFKTGLTSNTAAEKLKKLGYNNLDVQTVKWWEILLRQFKSAFVYLLLAAAVVSFILGEPLDGIFIIVFVVINSTLGFYQEYKSEQTVSLLKSYVQPKVKVIRNGKEEVVLGKELVVGDIVLLETGDIVPADLRIFQENNLMIDESVLTGESVQVKKIAEAIVAKSEDLYAASNISFMGTTVVSGVAKGVVISTGKNTEMGKIAKLTTETRRESGFEKQINKFSKFILYLILGTLAVVFVAHLFIHNQGVSPVELALFIVALAVGVIPEALPLVTTFALSRGAVNLTKKHVVVKRLSAIEDLGSIEILCSDKTGTLTENKLRVADIFVNNQNNSLMLYGVLSSSVNANNTRLANNAFDLAIEEHADKKVLEAGNDYERVIEIPFDPKRRRNSVLVKKDTVQTLIVRGAAESVLPFVKNINPGDAQKMAEWTVDQGIKGRRVIAMAIKENFTGSNYQIADEEKELSFVGLISFYDPVKASTKEAVEKANKLKVAIKILTGDSKEVAGAVAYEVGITDSPQKVMTGQEFDNLDEKAKMVKVSEYSVFARVSPEQKFKIIELLKHKYQVGYLGEGINDAPALKIANVALAVEGAADIARESADIILLSQDLQVIVDGIEEGRKTFVNTVKYIKSTLTSNFGNFYSVAFASLLIDYLPMLPIQILLVNLLSDFPMISIATDEVEIDELKNPKSYDIREIIIIATVLGTVSSLFDFIFFGVFSRMGEGPLQTYWFIGSILTELALLYSIRTKRAFFKATTRPSTYVTVLTFVAAVATVIIPFTTMGRSVFRFITPTTNNLFLVFGLVAAYFVTTEVAKLVYYRNARE